jgi:uncharacterized ferredoxin-like protein
LEFVEEERERERERERESERVVLLGKEGGGGSCVFCGVFGFWSEEEKKNLVGS